MGSGLTPVPVQTYHHRWCTKVAALYDATVVHHVHVRFRRRHNWPVRGAESTETEIISGQLVNLDPVEPHRGIIGTEDPNLLHTQGDKNQICALYINASNSTYAYIWYTYMVCRRIMCQVISDSNQFPLSSLHFWVNGQEWNQNGNTLKAHAGSVEL